MKKLITTITVALVSAAVVQADTIALWNLDGPGSSTSSVVTNTAAGVTGSDFAAAAASTQLNTGISWGNSIGTFAESFRLTSSLEFALSADNYFGFSATADAGKTISYDNLFARMSVNTGSGTADAVFTLMSSQTGFSTNSSSILGTFNVVDNVSSFSPLYYTTDFDLSGESALQNVSGATEFRIYVNVNVNGNRMGFGRAFGGPDGNDDIRLDGTVIPEPATLGLLGFAAAGLLWFRKRFSM